MKTTAEVLPAKSHLNDHPETPIAAPLNEVNIAGHTPAFEVVGAVTRPVLSFGAQAEYIRIENVMREGEVTEKAKYKSVPTLLDVINLRTGENMLIICATVFILEMNKVYPNAEYVGRDFQVRKIKTPERDYSLWAITEIKLK